MHQSSSTRAAQGKAPVSPDISPRAILIGTLIRKTVDPSKRTQKV